MPQHISLLTSSEKSSPEQLARHSLKKGGESVICLVSDDSVEADVDGTGRAELEDSQGFLFQAFRAKWMGNREKELADKPSVPPSYADQVPSSQVSEAGTTGTRKKTAPAKKPAHRAPRVKWQSFPEVIMMLDVSVIELYPELVNNIKAFHADSMLRDNVDSRAPQLTTVTGLGHGAVGWRRRPWSMGPANVSAMDSIDPFTEYPEDCPFRLFFRHVDEWVEDMRDFDKIERAIRHLHDTQCMTFLVVTGIKQAVDGHKKRINRQFKSAIGGGEGVPGDLTSEMTFWETWSCKLYRLCAKHGIHLMTKLNSSEAERDCPSALLAELSKGIAWQPYHADTNAGLSFASGTVKHKPADVKEEVWKRWLLELPRMSVSSAEAVARKWSSYSAFVRHFRGHQIDRAIAEVSQERLSDVRAIGPALATRICTHFLQ